MERGPDPTRLATIRPHTEHAREVLAHHDDDAGLALAAYVQGLVYLRRGELQEMEAIARRGLADAERSGNPREEAAMRWWVALALTDGPTPVADCIDECERLGQWHGAHHPGVLAELARLRAMQGDPPRGRD